MLKKMINTWLREVFIKYIYIYKIMSKLLLILGRLFVRAPWPRKTLTSFGTLICIRVKAAANQQTPWCYFGIPPKKRRPISLGPGARPRPDCTRLRLLHETSWHRWAGGISLEIQTHKSWWWWWWWWWWWCGHSSGAVWESRWPSWAVRPNEPYGFRGRKAVLNHASALVSACP